MSTRSRHFCTPQPCFQSSNLPWLSSLRVVVCPKDTFSLVVWPKDTFSLAVWPKDTFSLAVWPKGMFSLVIWPKGTFSLVVWPKGTFSLVVWPKGTFSLVVWPKGTFSLVAWPKGMFSLVVWPKAMFSLVAWPKAMFSLVVWPKAMFSLVAWPKAMFSLPRFVVRGNDQQQEQIGGAWHEVDCWRTEDLHRLRRWYGARLLSVCALGALPLAALISNLGEGVWRVRGVYWSHHVHLRICSYTGVTMSIWGYVLSGLTLCNQIWCACATSQAGMSCEKKWAAFERGVYDENMTVATISSELITLFKPNSVHRRKPKCPVKILGCCVQGEGHSKCSFSKLFF